MKDDIRIYFRGIVESDSPPDLEKIPSELINRLNAWQWGVTNWKSPASLILAACLWKRANPNGDCCRIWAVDSNRRRIPGGYSIRTVDEKQVIPVLSEFDLCRDFCSSNSGMQGCRALEKSRSAVRVDRRPKLNQSSRWDQSLFGDILNDVNEASPSAIVEVIKLIVSIARKQREKRLASLDQIDSYDDSIELVEFAAGIADPAFVTCLVAACLRAIGTPLGLTLVGADDHLTAADERASKPGDLVYLRDDSPLLSIEVKDKTKTIDWQNYRRAKEILANFPSILSFYFVLENPAALADETVNLMREKAAETPHETKSIEFLSLRQIYNFARIASSERVIWDELRDVLRSAPSVKRSTLDSLHEQDPGHD